MLDRSDEEVPSSSAASAGCPPCASDLHHWAAPSPAAGELAEDPAIARIAAGRTAATPSQDAPRLAAGHRDEHILLIPGTSSVVHLEENLAAADVDLDADDMTALGDVRTAGSPLEAVHE